MPSSSPSDPLPSEPRVENLEPLAPATGDAPPAEAGGACGARVRRRRIGQAAVARQAEGSTALHTVTWKRWRLAGVAAWRSMDYSEAKKMNIIKTLTVFIKVYQELLVRWDLQTYYYKVNKCWALLIMLISRVSKIKF
jgi:hypothetical protein